MTKYITRSRCRGKLIYDDEHIKTDFGYYRLNIRYIQCVRCRTYKTEYRETHRGELREKQTAYYYDTKEDLNKIKFNMTKYIMQKNSM